MYRVDCEPAQVPAAPKPAFYLSLWDGPPPFPAAFSVQATRGMGAGAMYITVLGIDLGKNSLCGRPR